MSTSPTPILRSIERDSNGLPTRVYSTSAGLKFAAVLDQRDKRRRFRPLGSLLGERWSLPAASEDDMLRAFRDAAPEVGAAYLEARNARDPVEYAAAIDRFGVCLDAWRKRTPLATTAADASIYHYTAPIVTLGQVWRKRITEPSLINILGRIATGDPRSTWQYYQEAFEAGLPKRDATHNPQTVMGTASEEREPIGFKMAWSALACGIDGRQRELHDAMLGVEGAPTWDLYGMRVDSISQQVWRDIARLVAFGDPTAGVHGVLETTAGFASGDTTGAGLLAVGAVGYLAGGTASYDAINGQIRAQADMVDEDEGLLADTLILPPADFRFLAQEILEPTAGTGKVMASLWEANPTLQTVTWAHECGPRAVDQAFLLAHGKSADEAARLSGGIRVAGVQKNCAILCRTDPQLLAWVEGVGLQVISYPEHRGTEATMVRASTGGARCFAQGKQAAGDPSPGAATGSFRIFWR